MFKTLVAILLFVLIIGCKQNEIKIYLAGDSTMAEKLLEKRPETGWGEKLGDFFNQNVIIKNLAKNGRSTRTFIEEGRWQSILDSLQKDNYVFIQFGHNDQSKEKIDRYTPPDQFRENLTYFIKTVREKDATPLLITPVVRRRFNNEGVFYDVHGEYPDLVREVASKEGVELFELHNDSQKLLIELGYEKSKELFLILQPGESENYPDGRDDNTHFSDYGAKAIAGIVANEIRNSNLALKKFLLK